jgi:hypothetical protein
MAVTREKQRRERQAEKCDAHATKMTVESRRSELYFAQGALAG